MSKSPQAIVVDYVLLKKHPIDQLREKDGDEFSGSQ
jgi:hypothetical protein